MTTIAFRDGVLAADTLVTGQGTIYGHTSKIARGFDEAGVEVLVAINGLTAMGQRFMAWAVLPGPKGAPPPTKEGDNTCEGILIYRNGLIVEYASGHPPISMHVPKDGYAAGSGRCEATGALAMGATALEAVKVAAKLTTATGGPFEILTFERTRPRRRRRSSR